MAAMDGSVPQLNYSPAGRRRRVKLWWWLVPLVGLSLGIGWWQLREPWAQWRERRHLARVVAAVKADAPAAGTVAYEDDPLRAAAIGRRPGYITFIGWDGKSRVGRVPPEWFELRTRTLDGWQWAPDDPVLFLHARTTARGTERLVLVHAKPMWPRGQRRVEIEAMLFSLGPQTQNLPELEDEFAGDVVLSKEAVTGSNGLRIFAGRADPSDASAFSIEYEIDGVRGWVDGRLTDGPGSSTSRPVEVELRKR
jgi:hypothetical protein